MFRDCTLFRMENQSGHRPEDPVLGWTEDPVAQRHEETLAQRDEETLRGHLGC